MDKQHFNSLGAYRGSKALVLFLKYSVFKYDTCALSIANRVQVRVQGGKLGINIAWIVDGTGG